MNTKFFASALVAAAGFIAIPGFAADDISGEVGYVPPVTVAASQVSREAVRAEYLQAQRSDVLPQTGEGADIGAVASVRSTLNRDTVRAEAVYAVQHGQQLGGEV